jgi:hypothetical protein
MIADSAIGLFTICRCWIATTTGPTSPMFRAPQADARAQSDGQRVATFRGIASAMDADGTTWPAEQHSPQRCKIRGDVAAISPRKSSGRRVDSILRPMDPSWRCSHCGGQHDRVNSFECDVISNYRCPWCRAEPGAPCIDARLHRSRKMQHPGFRARELARSRRRHRP